MFRALIPPIFRSRNTQSSAPEDGRDQGPKHVELIGIINKPLLLHLVGVYIISMMHGQTNDNIMLCRKHVIFMPDN